MISHLRSYTTIGRMEVKVIYLYHIARSKAMIAEVEARFIKANFKSEDRQTRQHPHRPSLRMPLVVGGDSLS
jgi:hypothetical protein